ncbi:MAG: ABC transporter ATP-binding protein [Clostridia bacterium]
MKTIKRIFGYYKPYLLYFFIAFVSLTTLTVLGLMRPKLIRVLIDDVIYDSKMNLLPWIIAALIGIAIGRGIFRFLQGYLSEKIAMNSIADIRRNLFNHLVKLPYSYYDKSRTGELMSRISSDVHSLKHLLRDALLELYDAIFTFSFVLIVLLRINWQLTLLALATLPFLFLTTVKFAYKIRPAYKKIREQMATMTTTIQENITGVRVVKAFNTQEHEIEKFDEDNYSYLEKMMNAVKIRATYMPLMQFLGGLSSLAIVWFGGYQTIMGNISVGELAEFYAYIGSLIWPIRRMAFLVNFFERSVAAGDRIFEILDTEIELKDKEDAISVDVIKGNIEFKDVIFSYGENDVLENINMKIDSGSNIGIIGETGSGKTSVVNLISRFYDVQNGEILIDGYNVKDLKLEDLRKDIGIVHQDIFLFSDTIKNNISFGNPNATDEQITKAAKIAQAHDFIMDMEKGYDTAIGERGIGLSGGQKQRIAIARALVRDPNILILDDATSSVDMETEHLIQQDMEQVMQNRTTIIIAHRIASVKNADYIYVLKEGQLVEQGTHYELLNNNGYYKQIFDVQYKEKDMFEAFLETGGAN